MFGASKGAGARGGRVLSSVGAGVLVNLCVGGTGRVTPSGPSNFQSEREPFAACQHIEHTLSAATSDQKHDHT